MWFHKHFLNLGAKAALGHLMRGAHEETSDRMKSARIGILILILIICGAVKPSSIENLVASAAAAAEPKPPEHATKAKGANEVNQRLMALSEEDRRSVFRRILTRATDIGQCDKRLISFAVNFLCRDVGDVHNLMTYRMFRTIR